MAGSSIRSPCPGIAGGGSQVERIERARRGIELPLGQVKIDRGLFEIAVPEEQLDGAQVCTGLEQVRGETVSQDVRVDSLFNARAFRRFTASVPGYLRRDRVFGCVVYSAGEEPFRGFVSAPVFAQSFEQLRAEHDLSILAAFARPDADDHPLTVDVAYLETGEFGAANAGRIQGHE